MKKILIILLSFLGCVVANDYSYKPYPVLVIHGLDNGPWTVGFEVDKDDKDELGLTTLIEHDDPDYKEKGYEDINEDDVFKCIHECYNDEKYLAPNHF